MKSLLASLLAFATIGCAQQPREEVRTMDPGEILFSIPTLSNDIAPLEPVNHQPDSTDLFLHEDAWSQVEFFPPSQLAEVQRSLTEYKTFERENRVQHGWRDVYVRRIERVPMFSDPAPLRRLEGVLGVTAGPAPVLGSSGAISGRVQHGFTLPLGGNVTLYGFTGDGGIAVLGASVGSDADDYRLTEAS